MKTKHRILSVLTVLALVASLTAVMVTPAAAIVTPTVTVDPPSAGVVGAYTIRFAITKALATADIIVVTFPAGTEVPMATAAAIGNITVNAVATTAAGTVVGQSVVFPIPALVPPGIPAGGIVTVVFTAAAGIVNPAVAGADYTLRVRTQAEPVDVTSAPYTIRGINLSPATGLRGTAVSIAGFGFPATAPGTITAPTAIAAPVSFTTTADGRIVATATIRADAAASPPPHTFTATVGVVPPATATFSVTVPPPVITLSPAAGPIGTVVNITGIRFPPNTAGAVTSPAIPLLPAVTFITTAAGEIPAGITATISTVVPLPVGPQTFTVTVGAAVDTETFTVSAPAITMSPTSGVAGTTVTVRGVGFVPFSPLALTIGPAIVTPIPTVIADSLGNFTTTFVVPGLLPAAHPVTATVAVATDTEIFTITDPPPIVPVEVGLAAVWPVLAESVWEFRDGVWYQYFKADPGRVPAAVRLTRLERGQAYWIFLERDITNVHFGGITRTLKPGWHNIGWL